MSVNFFFLIAAQPLPSVRVMKVKKQVRPHVAKISQSRATRLRAEVRIRPAVTFKEAIPLELDERHDENVGHEAG